MCSSPNTLASAGCFEKGLDEAASKKFYGSLDEEVYDVLFSDSVLKAAPPLNGNGSMKESGDCENRAFVGGGSSSGIIGTVCEEDIFGRGDGKPLTDAEDVEETEGVMKKMGRVSHIGDALGDLNSLVSGGTKDKEIMGAILGDRKGLEDMETLGVSRSNGLGGGVDDELLNGLYPEDFSFFLDCSAVLPHENTSTGSRSSRSPGPGGENGCGGEGDPCKHPSHEIALAGSHGTTASSTLCPSTHSLHMTACQLPQSCSSPPATASSLHKPKTPPSPPPPPPPLTSTVDWIDYPTGTFYGLPLMVQKCLEEHRGISKLYGNAEENPLHYNLSQRHHPWQYCPDKSDGVMNESLFKN